LTIAISRGRCHARYLGSRIGRGDSQPAEGPSRHGRSLQSELKMLVQRAAGSGGEQIAAVLKRWEGRFAGRRFSSSARLVREDRNR